MPAYFGENLTVSPLATPDPPTLTRHGPTGETTYGYKVVARRGDGTTEASAEATIVNGPSTLNAAHWVAITPAYVAGAASFDIYRTTGGGSTGKIGTLQTINVGTVQRASFSDRGRTGDDTSPPEANTTGQLILGGATASTVLSVDEHQAVTSLAAGSPIAAPSGGATQDDEARTAIGSILTLLQNLGLMQGD